MSYFEIVKKLEHGAYGSESADYIRGWKKCKALIQKKVVVLADAEIARLKRNNEKLKHGFEVRGKQKREQAKRIAKLEEALKVAEIARQGKDGNA